MKLKSTRHCCWHRNEFPTFYDHFAVFNFSSGMKKFLVIFWHFRTLVSGTPIFVFCFFFQFLGGLDWNCPFLFLFADASDICLLTSGPTLSGLEVVCFLVSLSPDHLHPSSRFPFNTLNLLKPVRISLFPFLSSNLECFSPTPHPKSGRLFWYRQCISVE